MLRVESLVYRAGGPALTFEAAPGRTVGLMGPDVVALLEVSELIAGLRAPSSGQVSIDGFDMFRDTAAARARMSVSLPNAANAVTTLGEHVTTIARARRTVRMPAAQAIDRLGLNARTRLNTPAARSAAALIGALIPDTSAIVLHEPFAALDDATRAKAIEWIRALGASASIVFIGAPERDVRSVSHSVIELGALR